ncbi:sulfite exporter TauE/SafE family protein [Haloarculaceae archaeon H-GB2-1]|nr:sulfite exporter TauE/SafE family protein [Haloarculaceae archaeon H-GB1-1]MEA5388373.1 sulfite exporter TauE/SafE family protein [Haloarculaceae archaeon H-GB11]MEA5406409.1 sulfite exporter TauE/SafE family protein [Haloarculaceae archaeon H-GB2-1]
MAVFGFEPVVFTLVLAIIFFGGLVKGIAGFGYAIASTAILASVLDPSTAVVVMILPMLAANVRLLGELDRTDLPTCVERFWPFVAAALVGTVAGMALLARIPKPLLALGLGLFTLTYVLVSQPYAALPGEAWVVDRCFRPGTGAKAILGLVSGLVFGASNIAVQIVAYLDSLSLDRSTFVGVLAMILVGVSSVRVGAAWYLGLYESTSLVVVSIVGAAPGLLGVAVGNRLRRYLSPEVETAGALVLLTVIGLKLSSSGLAAI